MQQTQITKNKKNIYTIILIAIFSMIIISILIPLFLDIFIFGNKFPSNISNSDWSSFLGSFLGGILGSVGSLIGIFITIFESRSIQNDTQKQKEIQMHKEKLDSIIEYTSIFWKEIKGLQTKISSKLQNQKIITEYEKELQKIKTELTKKPSLEAKQKNALLSKIEEYNKKIQVLEKQHPTNVDLDYNDLTYSYFMLTIILKDVQIAEDYYSSIKQIYEDIYAISIIDTVPEENLTTSLNFTNKLHKEFLLFVDAYRQKYITE